MAPVRVAQIVGNLETGGMQMLVMELMRHLDPKRFEPWLYSLRGTNHFASEIQERGWHFEQIQVSRRLRQRQVKDLATALRRDGIEIVHPHADLANIAGRAAGVVAGCPSILAHFHNTYEHRLSPERLEVENFLAQHTDAIVCCGHGVAEHYRETYKPGETPVRTIVNGFDLSPFRAASRQREDLRRKFGYREDEFIILHTARFEPHKQPGLLLEAVSIAAPRLKNWRVVYLGKGSLYDETVEQARRMFPEERVHFVGWSREVPEHLAAADVFVLCSRNEGLPLSVVEALASGVPVVASDITGPSEVLSGQECGTLIPMGNAAALAEAIIRLHDDRVLWQRYVENGRVRAEEYGIGAFINRVQELYDSVLAMPRRPRAPLGSFSTMRLLHRLRER